MQNTKISGTKVGQNSKLKKNLILKSVSDILDNSCEMKKVIGN